MDLTRQYERGDVDFHAWYTPWMKSLAAQYTRSELLARLAGTRGEARKAGAAHERALRRSCSMQGSSQARAQARNVSGAVGDHAIALAGAIEIHDLFPEHAR